MSTRDSSNCNSTTRVPEASAIVSVVCVLCVCVGKRENVCRERESVGRRVGRHVGRRFDGWIRD